MKKLLFKKINQISIKTLLFIIATYLFIHSFRNLFQYLGIKNFLTEIGSHELGVKYTNFLLSPLGLKYDVSQEIYYFFIELFLSILLFIVLARLPKKHILVNA